MQKLTEKQIEDVFELFFEQLIEPELKLIERQKTVKQFGVRFDLLFKDKHDKYLILELKRNAISRDDIGQTIQYAGIVKDSRVVLAAPIIPSSVKKAFEHYGIEYLEFDLKKIEELYNQIGEKELTASTTKSLKLPTNIIKEPLSKRKIVDGNVAFKVTYNDKDWKGICSQNVANFNFANRTWCKIQSEKNENCQSEYWKEKAEKYGEYPCMDAAALANNDPFFSGGYYHGNKKKDEPIRYLNIKKGKIAIFTSREPGEPESERFIFFIGKITHINEHFDGYEEYHCNQETGIYFNKNNYPKYWDFYKNPNKPEKAGWNTGLIRYWSDKQVINILEWIIDEKRYSNKLKEKAKHLLID